MKIALILFEVAGQPKLFGQYHDLALLLIGFVLTTIVGSIIAAAYQRRHWKAQTAFQKREWDRQNEALLRQRQTEQARELYSNITKQLSDYFSKVLSIDLKKKRKERNMEYELAYIEWKSQSALFRDLIYIYFGDETRNLFTTLIKNINRTNFEIKKLLSNEPNEDDNSNLEITHWTFLVLSDSTSDTAQSSMKLVNSISKPYYDVSELKVKMLKQIKDQNIGSFRREEPPTTATKNRID